LKICVDTTVFLDILKDEFRSFQEKLYKALQKREDLVVPSVVYGELLPQFAGNTKLLEEFLKEHGTRIEALDYDSVAVAAKAWMKYLKRKERVKCPRCGHILDHRAHFLSDFYIAGFASARCDAILTRDRGIYKRYFPNLAGYDDCLN
jgi:predicted nucleic acid-binding protein